MKTNPLERGFPFGNGEEAYSYQAAVGSVTGGQLAFAAAVYKQTLLHSRKGISKTKQIKT